MKLIRHMVLMAATIAVALPLLGQPAADAETRRWRNALRVGGFAALELHSTTAPNREGLDEVQLDLYASAALSDRWSVLAEGVATKGLRGADSRAELFDLDLERLYVAYSVSDALRFELGQTHTGIIRWNEREHRSRFLQTPIDVPAIARRPQDDGAWPLRFVGLWMSGRLRGPMGIGYGAGLGLGSGRNRDEVRILSSAREPAVLLSLSMAPDSVPGLEVGTAAYAQQLPENQQLRSERDFTVFVNYINRGTEVRAEWARMDHRGTASGADYRTTGFYVLLSKRMLGRAERIRPYLLIDRLNLAEDEAYLAETSPEKAWAVGVRYDLTRRWSVKGEYRSQRAEDGGRERLLGLQIGLAF